MKQTILHITLFLFAFSSSAQVTINATEFDRLGDYTDAQTVVLPTSVDLPTEGPDQFWDYSSLEADYEITTEHYDAIGNAIYPEATGKYDTEERFLGFPIPGQAYENLDEDGWSFLGNQTEEATISITAQTGGPDDVIHFPVGAEQINKPSQTLPFPLNYQSEWEENLIVTFNFDLSVAAFGLNNVPGYRSRRVSTSSTIAGYGELVIPKSDGTPSDPMEVLLLRLDYFQMDSIFLGGAPAPEALMNAFGLIQGEEYTTTNYIFYKPGFNSAVLFISGDVESTTSYRPQSADVSNITINASDFDRLGDYTDIQTAALQTQIDLPVEGSDQLWDYSNLVADFEVTTEHYDAIGNSIYPEATGKYDTEERFLSFPIPGQAYEKLDEDGWSFLGNQTEEATISIVAQTGGPDDIIHFPVGAEQINKPSQTLLFPLNYQSEWEEDLIVTFNFDLSVAAFGLSNVPGYRSRRVSTTKKIVGYGELIIPKSDGTPSEPMEVLLLRLDYFQKDSIFLGGAPAPEALMNAFGLIQGEEYSSTNYIFYKPGFNSAVLFISKDEDFDVSYRPQAADAVSKIEELFSSNLKSYPNPVSVNQELTIQTESEILTGSIQFIDLTGQIVYSTKFESAVDDQLKVQIPASFRNGFYVYQIVDKNGNSVGSGKLLIR